VAHLGWLLLVSASIAAALAVVTGRRPALLAAAGLLGGSTAVLAWALLSSDFTFAYVAGQSRRQASAWYRLAGLWGGPEGSLLVFTLLGGLAACVAVARTPGMSRRGMSRTVRLLAVPIAALAAVTAVLAGPFERLAAPALDGGGLTPILEHPAMAVHPPLLYLGLVATLPAFALAVAGLGGVGPGWPAVRRWLLAAVALLALAMALGGLWSYAEAGWGGYWAWDPVENTSLAPWLAALVAVHLGQAGRGRSALAVATLPWVLALAGAAITRSGATPSVHAFAESDRLGVVLAVLALGTAAVVIGAVLVSRERGAAATDAASKGVATVGAALLAAAAVVVLVGTASPVVRRLAGEPGTAVGGWFFADLVAPLALVGAIVLGAAGLRGRRQGLAVGGSVAAAAGALAWAAGWPFGSVVLAAAGSFVALGAAAALATVRRLAWLAHAGLGLLLLGVGASGAAVERTVPLDPGDTVRVAGVTVTYLGVDVVDGPRPGTEAVVAELDVRDGGRGRRMRPSLVAYPDRGGVLAETSLWARPWHDVQVVLLRADDDQRAVLTVRVRPLAALVWLGALAIVAGSAGSALVTRRRARPREPVPV
jgi:cytochrome c-type biogenesis protein CcmF